MHSVGAEVAVLIRLFTFSAAIIVGFTEPEFVFSEGALQFTVTVAASNQPVSLFTVEVSAGKICA